MSSGPASPSPPFLSLLFVIVEEFKMAGNLITARRRAAMKTMRGTRMKCLAGVVNYPIDLRNLVGVQQEIGRLEI